MTGDQQRLVDYLAHIAEAIERIRRYTAGMDEAAFLANPLVQDAVIRNLEIIGEANHNIEKHYPAFARAHPDMPLSYDDQMRNAVSQGYFKVDFEIVWRTMQRDLPSLYQRACELMSL